MKIGKKSGGISYLKICNSLQLLKKLFPQNVVYLIIKDFYDDNSPIIEKILLPLLPF